MTTHDTQAAPHQNVEVTIEQWATQLGLGGTAVLTVKETAELMRISERKVYDFLKDGTIPSVRFGRRVLIHVPGLLRILAADSTSAA